MSPSPIGRKPPAGRSLKKRVASASPDASGVSLVSGSASGVPSVPVELGEASEVKVLLRAHVEQALLGVLGAQLALVPRFQDIVNEAVAALWAEPALHDSLREAGQELLDRSGSA